MFIGTDFEVSKGLAIVNKLALVTRITIENKRPTNQSHLTLSLNLKEFPIRLGTLKMTCILQKTRKIIF